MIELTKCAGEAERQLSLDIYNAVWPHEAVTMAEVKSFETAVLGHQEMLARVDGELARELGGAGEGVARRELPLPDLRLDLRAHL